VIQLNRVEKVNDLLFTHYTLSTFLITKLDKPFLWTRRFIFGLGKDASAVCGGGCKIYQQKVRRRNFGAIR
jgi:hypothetical protein